MARMSILTGRSGSASTRARAPAAEPDDNQELKAVLGAMDLLKAQVERMSIDIQTAVSALAASRSETATERAKAEALRAQLMEEADACGEARGALAAERAVSAGLRAQLETEHQARLEMQASMDKAVTAAAAKQDITFPKHEPVAYEVEMVNPDTGERKQVSIKPAKAKG